MEYFDIKDKAYSMPSELSGGQNQRAAIARSLANHPPPDHPYRRTNRPNTAALDSKRSVDVVKMLKKIATEQNVAVIMVTHDEAMLPLCDRVLTIEEKKVVSKQSEKVKIL